MRKFFVFLVLGMSGISVQAGEIDVPFIGDEPKKCDYRYEYAAGDKVNICQTQTDAECLWGFSVADTLYNLNEHYVGETEFYCEPATEFKDSVYQLTVDRNDADY